MAIIKNGILGGFSGKAGTVIGYNLNGQDIIRGEARLRTSPFTPQELVNQKKFGVSQRWLQPLTPFLRIGFQHYQQTFQGFTAAKSYNSKHALKGEYPDFFIDPSLALLSFGEQGQAASASAVSENPYSVTFNWSTEGKFAYDDRAMLVAYDIINERAVFDTAAAKRSKGTANLYVGKGFSGKKVQVFLAFVSEDRKARSNSQYLGEITVL